MEDVRRLLLVAGLVAFGWGTALAGQRQDLADVAGDAAVAGGLLLAFVLLAVASSHRGARDQFWITTGLMAIVAVAIVKLSEPDLPSWHRVVPALMMAGGGLTVLGLAGAVRMTHTGEVRVQIRAFGDRRCVRVDTPEPSRLDVVAIFSYVELDLRGVEISDLRRLRLWSAFSRVVIVQPRDAQSRVGRSDQMAVHGSSRFPEVDATVTFQLHGWAAWTTLSYAGA